MPKCEHTENLTDCLPVVDVERTAFHALTEAACIRHVLDELDAERGGWLFAVNVDVLRRMRRDPVFNELCSRADLRVADGMPILWAARLQGTRLPDRVCGSNLISSLSGGAAARGRSVFLLGGDDGTAEACAEELTRRFPGMRIAGTYCPPFGFEKNEEEMARLVAALRAANPDIIFVALGCPKQEHLVRDLRDQFPRAWWVGVGISFSFLSGQVSRAPAWLQRIGCEWVHRLIQEPRRLARRYLIEDVPFALSMLGRALLRRVTRR